VFGTAGDIEITGKTEMGLKVMLHNGCYFEAA
jgi:hypothetical protein